MKNTTTALFLMLCFLTSTAVFAQKDYNEEADKAYNSGEYFTAIELYKKISAKEKNKTKKAAFINKIGDSYMHINDMAQAEKWFEKAISAGHEDPKTLLNLGFVKKENEKYNEALIAYNDYLKLVPGDKHGIDGAESCKQAQSWKDKPTRYVVKNIAELNSKGEDFAPAFSDKKHGSLAFTSTREGVIGSEVDHTTGESFSDIFEVKLDKKGKWSTPIDLGAPLNTTDNEGASCFNAKASKIFFTRCPIIKKKSIGCEIFYAERKGTSWSDPVLMKLCPDSFTVGHPSISKDDKSLYFASNMPGGKGGKDIWVVHFDKKTKAWGAPINLGEPVNTDGDEMYPYIREDGKLFFSSNEPIGMGGLDIFSAEPAGDKGEKFANVTNLKYPLNSAGDDFGLIYDAKSETGFLTSNRVGGKGSDDLYSFYLPSLELALQGVVTDVDTKAVIANATIKLIGSDGTSVELKTDASGFYKFDRTPLNKKYIVEKVNYSVAATMDQYLGDKADFTTVGVDENTVFKKDLVLKSTKKGPIVLPEILYDLAKWDLKPQYQDSLNGLIKTLSDNPNIVIELGSHTDTRGDHQSNVTLAQNRAQSVVDYLITKGIDPDRLKAKGYGEDRPLFTDSYIDTLSTDSLKEYYHQKNRRTDFHVIREDFVPKVDTSLIKKTLNIENIEGEETEEEEKPADAPKPAEAPTDAPQNNTGTKPEEPKATDKPKH